MKRFSFLAIALMAAFSMVAPAASGSDRPAQAFTVLYSFTGSSDGAYPYGGLVRDAAGNLYGTTEEGGAFSYGTVFKVDVSGTETVLHSFAGGTTDGEYPLAGLLRDSAGNLYGTTQGGGPVSAGTVFKIDNTGAETVLYTFTGGTTDGCTPFGGVIQDKSGNLYGTTQDCGAAGFGTVYKLSSAGVLTLLHSFAGGTADGQDPIYASLLLDSKGNLYGVTDKGGSSDYGVLYKLSKSGKFAILHSFTGASTDGCYPLGTPIMDKTGNLYGTTDGCGSSFNAGEVWKLNTSGQETLLHVFAGGAFDGSFPYAGVLLDTQGNVYGDTQTGGASGFGVLYKVSKTGTLTLLHSFSSSDGEYPVGGVLRDAKGILYGTTNEGGSGGFGTVWSLK